MSFNIRLSGDSNEKKVNLNSDGTNVSATPPMAAYKVNLSDAGGQEVSLNNDNSIYNISTPSSGSSFGGEIIESTSTPTTRNNGGELKTGDIWFNSTDSTFSYYVVGTGWDVSTATTSTPLSTFPNDAGYITSADIPADTVTSVNGQTGDVVLTFPGISVTSVNTQTGDVVLDASDVGAATTAQGALADTSLQPSAIGSTIQPYDAHTVVDPFYVRTDNNFTAADKNKLDSIEPHVNADWTATSGGAEILNKPTLGTAAATDSSDYATAAQGVAADSAVQPTDIGVTVQGYDANIVIDANYVRTDNNFTDADSTKLDGIEAGAEVNVQSDWNATSGGAEILNKPTLGTASGLDSSDFATATQGATADSALQPADIGVSIQGYDSDIVIDANYVRTDNNFTDADSNKLDGIEAGAEVNVNADWSATTGDAAILNKPTLGTAAATDSSDYATAAQGLLADSAVQPTDVGVTVQGYDANTVIDPLYVRTDENFTTADSTKLDGIEAGAEVNVQSDWNATSGDAFIQNKPTLGTAASTDSSDYATAAQGLLADTSLQTTDLGVTVQGYDVDTVIDANYVRTDNNFTDADSTKLDGIEAGAEANVNADWTATSGDSFIQNKPTLGTAAATDSSDYATAAQGLLADSAVQPTDVGVTVQGYDSDTVIDAFYVRTDNNFTDADSNKLDGIEAGAEVNVQSDWNATSGDAFIQNKPTLGTASGLDSSDFATAAQGSLADTSLQTTDLGVTVQGYDADTVIDPLYVRTDENFTTADHGKLDGIEAGAEVNVQSDWSATSGDSFIQNKPTLGTAAATDSSDYATAAQGVAADSAVQPTDIGVTVQPYNQYTVVDAGYVSTEENFTTAYRTKLDSIEEGAESNPVNVSELNNDAGYLTSAPVDSVNGQTGVVILDAADVGAATAAQGVAADSAVQPSDIGVTVQPYDSDTVIDPLYVRTDENFTTADSIKLDGIEAGAEVNPANVSELTNDAGYVTSVPVDSVNGQTGAVVLDASDVGAATTAQGTLADSSLQPTDIGVTVQEYDVDTVVDPFYVRTQQSFTTAEKNKLAGIDTGAEVNVQSDWTATSGDAFIQNKPTLGTAAGLDSSDFATSTQGATADSALQPTDLDVTVQSYHAGTVIDPNYVHTDNNFSDVYVTRLSGIEPGAEVNVQSDWNSVGGDSFILNKPTLGTAAATDSSDYATAAQGITADSALQPTDLGVTVQGYDADTVVDSLYVRTDNNFTNADSTKLDGIEAGAEVNVNADWNATVGGGLILNKPVLGTAALTDSSSYATSAQGALADTSLQNSDLGVTVQGYDADTVIDPQYVRTDHNFTTADHNKLDGIEAGAEVNPVNVSELVNDAGYLTSVDIPDDAVLSVNGQAGIVVLDADSVGALKTGDNISELVNDAGYITSIQVPQDAVLSVNSQSGIVVLDASDVGAATTAQGDLADSSLQPADIGVSVQGYDSDTVIDANYVHTDNNFTGVEKTKLAGIESGAQVNVNADWSSASGDSQILNKPTFGTAAFSDSSSFATSTQGATADSALQPTDLGVTVQGYDSDTVIDAFYVRTDNNFTDADSNKLDGIEAGAEANVQIDWTATSGDAAIINKPVLGTAASTDSSAYATAAQGALADTSLQNSDLGFAVQPYDADTVIDALYVRTDNNFTDADSNKLDGIQSGAEVNVKSDWTATSGDAQILNKPTLGTAAATDSNAYATAAQGETADSALQPEDLGVTVQPYDTDTVVDNLYVRTQESFTTAEKSKLAGVEAGAEANVNADWTATSGDAAILNKPTLGTAAATDSSDYATATQGATADSALQPADIGVSIQGYDADIVIDANYVSTDENFTTADHNKLDGIQAGAEVNVNADWSATTGDAAILNKPTLGTAATTDSSDYATAAQGETADSALQPTDLGVTVQGYSANTVVDPLYVRTDENFTTADHTKLDGIEAGAEVNVQSDWTATSGDAFIQNKPALGTAALQNTGDFATAAQGGLADSSIQPSDVGVTVQGYNANTVIDPLYVRTDENFTTADSNKLDSIEVGATGDQTAAEIKVAYESNSDTNAFTDAEQTKLSGIEAGAEVNVDTDLSYDVGSRLLVSSTGTDVTLPLAVANASDGLLSASDQAQLDSLASDLSGKADLSGGKLLASQLPDIAVSEYLGEVASEAAMLLLDGQEGDWVNRSDDGKVYVITGSDPSLASNWTALSYPVASGTNLSYDSSTRVLASSNGTDATLTLATASGDDGLMSGSDKAKLDGIEAGATADQTGAEIKSLYESQTNTNAFTDADATKLDGIEAGAEVNVNADWNSVGGDSLILNKPTLGTAAATDSSDYATAAQGATADSALQPTDVGSTVQGYDANTVIDAFYVRTDNNFTNADSTKLDGIEAGAEVNVQADWNATTGDAAILNKPTLGTAATTDSSDYATAAQGALADTALQSSDISVTVQPYAQYTVVDQFYVRTDRNFTNADHNKLDGIEAGATADQTAAEIKVAYESNADTNVFNDAEKSKLSGIEAGAEVNVDTDLSYIQSTNELTSSTGASTNLPIAGPQNNKDGLMSHEDKAKLDGIEAGATADQTGAEIKSLYESQTNTNAFTDADTTKLDSIEAGATADQTGAEIKSLYEAEADTNAFTDADATKLGGIEAGAEVNLDTNLSYTQSTNELASSTGTNVTLPLAGAGANEDGLMSHEDKSKLDGIEVGATADQNGAEIKSLYESEPDTNAFTDAEQTKLAGIEVSATGDQTGAEIKAAYESNADTNAFDDAALTKLAGIEPGAEVNLDTDLSYTQSTNELASSTGTNVTLPLAGDQTDEDGLMSHEDKAKLDGVEAGATGDQTGAEIKALYEAEANAFTDTQFTKLAGIEAGATADQTAAEIKTAYESNADTNVFDDAAVTKLAGIEAAATADQTGAEIKSLYEAEADTNAFDDAAVTKLAGIEAGAEVNVDTDLSYTQSTNELASSTGTNVTLPLAGAGTNEDGLMSHEDKAYLDSVPTTLSGKADLSGGKLLASQLPDLAVTEYLGEAANETAMLALSGQKGDWVNRSDDGKVYVISGTDPSAPSNWTALNYPASSTTNLSYDSATRAVTSSTGTDATLPLVVSGGDAGLISGSDKSKIDGIEAGAQVNVQADWTATTGDAFIQNKPTLGTAAATDSTDYATAAQGLLADSAIQPTDSIDELVDVDTTTVAPTDGQVLMWDNTNSVWEPGTVAPNTNLAYTASSTNGIVSSDNGTDATIPLADGTDAGLMSPGDFTKLSGIEAGATADQTDAEIKTAYENNLDTNAFTDAEQTKLAGIAAGAEVNVDTNLSYTQSTNELASSTGTNVTLPLAGALTNEDGLMSHEDKAKLDGIEAGATADQTGAEIKALYEAESDTNAFTDADVTKLAGIEAGATADQTGAEIKALYEAEADTNAFTDADVTKLAGIEAGATADQTAAEIKTAYESNADTNAFTDAEQTKLAGIEAGATADQTAAEIKTAYESNADTNVFDDAAVTKLAGIAANATNVTTIDTLTDVDTTTVAPADGQVLMWDNTNSVWEPGTVASPPVDSVNGYTGAVTLDPDDLDDAFTSHKFVSSSQLSIINNALVQGADLNTLAGVTVSSPADDEFLRYDGTQWVNESVTIPTNNNQLTNGAGYITSADGGNAATIDGLDSLQFLRSDANDTATGNITLSGGVSSNGKDFYSSNGAFIANDADGGAFGARTGNNIDHIWHDDAGNAWNFCSDTTYKNTGNSAINCGNINATNAYFSAELNLMGSSDSNKYLDARVGTGTFHIRKTTGGDAGHEVMATFTGDAGVALYYNGVSKLETTASGAEIEGNTVWHAGNDGSGSGLDADKVDNLQASQFLRSDTNDVYTGTLTGAGNISFSGGNIEIGNGSGSVAMTINDGYGNANLCFNHAYGVPDVNGNALRIETNVDATSGAVIVFEGRSNVTANTAVVLNQLFTMDEGGATCIGNVVWHAGNDGAGSGLDADTLDGIDSGSFLRSDANDYKTGGFLRFNDNLNLQMGTDNDISFFYNGSDFYMDFNTAGDSWYIRDSGDSAVFGFSESGNLSLYKGDLNVGDGGDNSRILIKKADNNASDHIQFYNGTTRIGEIGCEDGTWLRINQETAKNIYTPRYIRADGGFFVDGASKGINGSGNFIGGTIAGASDYGTLLRSNADDSFTGTITGNTMLLGSSQITSSSAALQVNGFQRTGNIVLHEGGNTPTAGADGTISNTSGSLKWNGSTVWTAANDGAGSGLDADKLDGLSSASFLRSDATDQFEGQTSGRYFRFRCPDGRNAGSTSGTLFPLEVYQNSNVSNSDAAMTFHISGRYATYFGLDRETNDLFTGGWSDGSTKHKIWHAGNDGSGSGLDADTIDGTQLSNLMTLSGTQTITGNKDFDGTLTYDLLQGPTSNTRDKIRVWNNSAYSIGMASGFSYGGLNGYAMTFQMNNTSDRGWWWGDSSHTDAQGAASLTTLGKMTVAHSLRIGYGESDTTTPGATHRLDVSGSILATGDITAFSDINLKENIEVIPDALNKVSQLRGVTYNRTDIEDERRQAGVIAQEVEEVLPEVVHTNEDGIKSVAYGNLVGLLIESIKELKAEVEALKAERN